MKLYARITNEKGKVDGLGGNETLEIDISAYNQIIARLTVKENEEGVYTVYNENGADIDSAMGG